MTNTYQSNTAPSLMTLDNMNLNLGTKTSALLKEPCPHCGYCPHCGKGGYQTYPYYSPYPYQPIWQWFPQASPTYTTTYGVVSY